MRLTSICCSLAFGGLLTLQAAPPSASAAQLRAQVRRLTEERDGLKQRLAATGDLQEELAAARKSRELAQQETEAAGRELAQLKAVVGENQGSGDAMLQDLQKAQADVAACKERMQALQEKLDEANARLKAPAEGNLVLLSREVEPARPINLRKVTPSVRKASGAVVVNVLVSENGEVLDVRLIQGVNPGVPVDKEADEHARAANAACLEAAKRLIFDPARTSAGTRVRVWQGVAFFLD